MVEKLRDDERYFEEVAKTEAGALRIALLNAWACDDKEAIGRITVELEMFLRRKGLPKKHERKSGLSEQGLEQLRRNAAKARRKLVEKRALAALQRSVGTNA